ncbi:hypothetical protein [Sphingomonas sp. M1-B02]|uniref:hypothetical protein n=1 Tax=Sphingomonas sp. M1-B02 TaxID=3114300 RepID=UPI002240725C|nr:hypothetical protein [Sphingomonas sp. S6-11]UZK65527.1 hypothetical protein OKW87_13565 [Sphingomonas sp. S6-11]
MKSLIAMALVALAAPGGAQEVPALPPARVIDSIEMETLSWGRPVTRWTIDAQGNGRETRAEPNAFEAKALVTRGFAVGTSGFRRMRVLLGRAEARGGADLPCADRMTDQPYGSVRWLRQSGSVAALAFDSGCRDSTARRVLDDLQAANALVAGWAQAGKTIETREVEKPE